NKVLFPTLRSSDLYCTKVYESASGNWDLFCVFVERAVSLCKPGGLSSLIVPNKLGSTKYAEGARRVLTDHALASIRDYSDVPVFPVAVYPIIYVVKKIVPPEGSFVSY